MSGIRQTNVIDSRGQEMLTAAVIVKEGGDPEVAKADQPEVRDLVQQVAREEEEQDEGYSRCKESSIIHH